MADKEAPPLVPPTHATTLLLPGSATPSTLPLHSVSEVLSKDSAISLPQSESNQDINSARVSQTSAAINDGHHRHQQQLQRDEQTVVACSCCPVQLLGEQLHIKDEKLDKLEKILQDSREKKIKELMEELRKKDAIIDHLRQELNKKDVQHAVNK